MTVLIRYRLLAGAVAALLICLLSPALLAQESPKPRWSQITRSVFHNPSVEQGLPFGRVPAIALAGQGFAWLATSDGLARWDGVSLLPLVTEMVDVNNDIRALKADPGKQLWVATGRALRRFDPGSSSWQGFELLQDQEFAVTALDFSGSGQTMTVWVGSERGVFSLNPASGEVHQYLSDQVDQDLTMRVFAVLVSSDGSIWAGTSNGLFRKSLNDSRFEAVDLAPVLGAGPRIATLVEASNGKIWVGTPRDGVLTIGMDGQVAPVAIEGFSGEWIFSMAEVSPGLMWLGSYGRGLIEIDLHSHRSRRMTHQALLKNSVADDEIWTIKADSSGLVWVGTSAGLSVHDLRQQGIQTASGGSRLSGELRDNTVTSLLELDDGRVLVGMRVSGVDVIDPALGRIAGIEVDADSPLDHLPGGAIEAMTQMDDGSVFFGSNWGLYRLAGEQVERVALQGRPDDKFTGSLLADGGYLWAGGSDGLWRISPGVSPASVIQLGASVSGGFTDPRITTLISTTDGEIVAGTWNGVTWTDQAGAVTQRLPAAGQSTSPLDNGYITALLVDTRGRTWIGTSGAGIYVRESNGRLHHLDRRNGLPSDLSGGLLEDRQGRIWASSNGGLAVINPDDFSIHALGPADGAMVTPYFRQPTLKTRSGDLLFGGNGGLTIVSPNQWQPRTDFAPLAISGIRIGDQALVAAGAGSSASQPLRVDPERNSFSVEFAALDFLAARSLKYRHQLVGFDSGWKISSAGNRIASYTSLAPGRYELKIQASNRQGQWPEAITHRYFRVLPYWYQTSVFKGLAIMLAGALMMLTVRWRTAQLQRRQLELEDLVDLRTRELQITAAELEEKSIALETASLTDPLTGLSNRRFLEQHLPTDQAMCFRGYREARGELQDDGDLLLFMVDIDHFKQVNDRHGHAAGDAVLRAMPGRLQQVFRQSDYLVRWGGEEFVVVARRASRAHVEQLARRISTQVSEMVFETDHTPPLSLTCSVGYCALPFDPLHPDALGWQDGLRLADMALYAAKRAGRNAWAGIEAGPELDGASDMRFWLTEPRAALLEGQIRLSCSVEGVDFARIWGDEPADPAN